MGKSLYIGNLSYDADEGSLTELFIGEGFSVIKATVVLDRDTGRSRGFGFVELGLDQDVGRVIQSLDGRSYMGRALRINEARPREEKRGLRAGRSRS